MSDLSDGEEAEASLQTARQQLEILLQTVPDEAWLKDREGRYVVVNETYSQARGLPREAIIGKTDLDLFPRELAERFRETDAHVLRQGQGIVLEYSLPGADGAPRWYEEVKAPLLLESGEMLGTVGISRDITLRRETELALRESEERFQQIAANVHEVFWLMEVGEGPARDFRMIYVSPAYERIFGRSCESVMANPASALEGVSAEHVAQIRSATEEALSGHESSAEYMVLHPEKGPRWIRTRYFPVRDERDRVYRIAGLSEDITLERSREVYLRRAERLASVATLIGGVAHELNNPLTAIRSFAQLMLMDERSEEDREALEAILREADRAARTVADLRQLASGNSSDAARGRQPLDLNEVVRNALSLRRYSLEAAGVAVTLELAGELPPVMANRGQLEQAVLHLLVNAEQALAKATGERRLTVRTRAGATGSSLHVIDSGPGIPAKNLGRIFDPFFTTRAPGEGIGLGLSLVHSIITEHGGEIHVDSRAGQGTAFRVELPPAPWQEPRAARTSRRAVPATRVLRVLVVDDEEAIRFSVSRYLGRRGHRVAVAGDGAEALRLVEEAEARGEGFDVVLSDLRMPVLGGEDLFLSLRDRGSGLHRRVVFMSGDAPSANAARGLADVDIPVLHKPFELEHVARLIESLGGA